MPLVVRNWLGIPILASSALGAQALPDSEAEALISMVRLMNTPIAVASTKVSTVLNSPSTVSVVDRQTLDRYGFQSLAEALEIVSGMAITRPLWHKDVATSRGVTQEGYANRVLFLVNGVPNYNSVTGDAVLGRISIEDVERIEVLKGPASVLYGTGAYAGAINVVLRTARVTTTKAYAGIGDQGGYKAGASHLNQWGEWNLFAAANEQRAFGETRTVTPDPSPTNPPFVIHDDTLVNNGTLRLEGHGLVLMANTFHERLRYFGAGNSLATGGNDLWHDMGYFYHVAYAVQPTPTTSLQYAYTYDRGRRIIPGSINFNFIQHQQAFRRNHSLKGTWDVSPTLGFEGGASTETRVSDYYNQFRRSTGALDNTLGLADKAVQEKALFGQMNYARAPWTFVLGSRHTRNELAGNNTSSRLSVVYAFSDQRSLKVIYGQSFRAPALLEQFFDLGTLVQGNRNLKPEQSDSLELGYMESQGNLFFQAIAFVTSYRDKAIRARLDPTKTTLTYSNTSAFKSHGLEVEVKYQNPETMNAFLNLDYVTGNDGDRVPPNALFPTAPAYNFKMVPKFSASFGLSKSLGALTGSLLINHQSGFEGPNAPVDKDGRTWEAIPAWTGIDLSLSYTHRWQGLRLRHTAALKNSTDAERWAPESIRRNINRVPYLDGRKAWYTVGFTF